MSGNNLQLKNGNLVVKNNKLVVAGSGDPCCCVDVCGGCSTFDDIIALSFFYENYICGHDGQNYSYRTSGYLPKTESYVNNFVRWGGYADIYLWNSLGECTPWTGTPTWRQEIKYAQLNCERNDRCNIGLMRWDASNLNEFCGCDGITETHTVTVISDTCDLFETTNECFSSYGDTIYGHLRLEVIRS